MSGPVKCRLGILSAPCGGGYARSTDGNSAKIPSASGAESLNFAFVYSPPTCKHPSRVTEAVTARSHVRLQGHALSSFRVGFVTR